MKLVKQDLWESKADVILVTGNSYVNRAGELVMGRGAALELKNKWPVMPKVFGDMIKQASPGNRTSEGVYGMLVSVASNGLALCLRQEFRGTLLNETVQHFAGRDHKPLGLGVFQVKFNWADDAEFDLIQYSAHRLNTFCEKAKGWTVAMNFPGIGYGRLDRAEVLPLLEELPDQVTIHEK